MSVRLRYSRSVKIINKGSNPITYPTSGTIVNGDLDAYVLRLELIQRWTKLTVCS